MIQTVIVNSALSQNWVGCTPKAQAARMLRSGRAHAACWVPCHGALGAVSWPPSCSVAGASCRVVAGRRTLSRCVAAPLSRYKKLYRDTEPMPRALRVVSRAHSAVSQPMSLPLVTIQNLYCDTPPWPGPARAVAAPTHRPAVSHALLCALVRLCPVVSRYNLLYRDPAPASYTPFFFPLIFFSFVLLTVRPQFFFFIFQ